MKYVDFKQFTEDFKSVYDFCFRVLQRLSALDKIPEEYYSEGILEIDEEGITISCTEEGDTDPFYVKVIFPDSKICSEEYIDEATEKTIKWLEEKKNDD